ncbi:MAG: hypothetical protein H6780_04365 [Candidatus Nomurabacteria bacterium]|nr:MAG: hypothetical protein H6780_04365 [Candidatus Nomurabacteria bacterium]
MQSDEAWFQAAVVCAQSAQCSRAKCGAIIVKDSKIIGQGYNAPPQDQSCNAMCHKNQRNSPKPKSDRTCCMHAEWRAILDALQQGHDVTGTTLYFARATDEGELLFSGQPYCTVCSRLALDVGIAYFGLWHESGPKLYDTKTYNKLSYKYHDQKTM